MLLDLKSLLSDFSIISVGTQELVGENLTLKKTMEEKEAVKDLQRKHTMLEVVHQQLVVMPELRMKVGELTKAMMELEWMSTSKNQELTRLKQKHLADMNRLNGEIE